MQVGNWDSVRKALAIWNNFFYLHMHKHTNREKLQNYVVLRPLKVHGTKNALPARNLDL